MTRRGIGAVVLAAVLAVGVGACGESDVEQTKFRSALQDKAKLTKAQSGCVTEKTYAEFDQDVINKLYTVNSEEDLPKGVADTFRGFVRQCTTEKPG